MAKNLITEAQQYLSSRSKDKRRSQVLRIVAVLVVFVTIYTLILPAVTMSNEVECGMEEHIHTDDCWEMRVEAPQPELTCGVGSAGEIVVHTHDSCCYDSRGNLTCALPEAEDHVHGPECYHEQRTLLCQEHQDLGHQHAASCYSYVRMDGAAELPEPAVPLAGEISYICGMQAGEGAHAHREECYPEERMAEARCGFEESEDVLDEEGNLVQQGHRHTDECYKVRIQEKLVCGQEESDDVLDSDGNVIQQGHRHNSSCYLRGDALCFQYGCRQHESAGHQHTDDCAAKAPEPEPSTSVDGQGEQWQKTLICREEERQSGHIHTDDCYEIDELFVCRKQVMQVHSHNESCYGEGGAPVCGKLEVTVHQHTADCFTTLEGDEQETEVLVCGQEEHTHVEQCYVKSTPKSEETFYCGLNEHTHTHSDPDCYFESGALVCTLVEHSHNLTCMEEPVEVSDEPGESEDPEQSENPQETQRPRRGVMLEGYTFTYGENEAYTVTYTINGFAVLDDGEDQPEEAAPAAGQDPDHTPAAPSAEPEPDPTVEPDPTMEPAAEAADPVPTPSSEILVDIMNQMVPLAAMPLKAQRLVSQLDGAVMPVQEPESGVNTPIDPSQVKCHVIVLEENDPRYQAMAEIMDRAKEEEDDSESFFRDIIMLVCTVNGKVLDLSGCEVSTVVTPKPALITVAMSDEPVTASAGDSQDDLDLVPTLSVYSINGREQTVTVSDEVQDEQQDENGTVTLAEEETPLAYSPLSSKRLNSRRSAGGVVTLADVAVPLSYSPLSNEQEEDKQNDELPDLSDYDGVITGVLGSKQANPSFTVQYYANLKRAVQVKEGKTLADYNAYKASVEAGELPLINTDGGKLPTKGTNTYNSPNSNPLAYLKVENGKIKTETKLTEIYQAEEFEYQRAPGLKYFNIVLTNSDSHYDLKEIWVLNDKDAENSTDKNGWTTYTYTSDIRFTNRAETAANNSNYILIKDGAVIRLVYDTAETDNKNFPANFYDYDITTQYIYTEPNPIKAGVKKETSNQTNNSIWYAWTWERGINHKNNYSGSSDSKLAFGNSSSTVNTGLGEKEWNGNTLNKTNPGSFLGCTFGLAKTMDANGKIQYASGVNAPNLFNDGTAAGKAEYVAKAGDKFSLNFDRVGDTYTLKSVQGTDATNLDCFNNPQRGSSTFTHILTNNFWPMDSASSWGTNGHDLKFGSLKYQTYRRFYGEDPAENRTYTTSKYTTMPLSDDGEDHNSYFGMQFAVEFNLSSSYVGPLEYYFFGDDDMWVFLGDKLVCDIGGVHSSVGEYVNLWDYVDRSDLLEPDENGNLKPIKVQKLDKDGKPIQAKDKDGKLLFEADGTPKWELTDKVKTYKLSFFYTERGASGSTCWMQFTLPTVVGLNLDAVLDEQVDKETGSISVEKSLRGIENTNWFEFEISGLLDNYEANYRLLDANGNPIDDDTIKNDPEYQDYRLVFGGTSRFKIRAGDILVLRGIKPGTEVTVTELNRDGYHTTIQVNGDEIESQDTTGKLAIEKGQRIEVVFTNIATYELPATGGAGIWYTMAGLPLTTAMFCVWYKKKPKGKGALR